jgi:integrase/recombinase XerD
MGEVMDVVDDVGAEVEELLAEFSRWLSAERAVAGETIRCYRVQSRKFLTNLPSPLGQSLMRLDAAAVTGYVLEYAAGTDKVWSAKTHVTALRSLLRFLHVRGWIRGPLVGAVPAVAGWRLASLPKGLPSVQVQALLDAHDLDTTVGLRDHAVLVVLARLGLRGAEAANLQLADVEWRAGQLVIHGKGSRIERLPLPAEVGQALAAYVTGSRPRCECPSFFVTARRPFRPLTPGAVRAIMGRACGRADLPRLGAHRLRHTLATDLLRAGASLPEIGQVLRHRSQLSTAIYAKVDYATLRTLARPWPGGAR